MSQITFTTADVQEAAKWLDFVYKNARWGDNITTAHAQDIGRLCNWMHKHVKMMNDHILELVEHVTVPDAEKAKQDKAEKATKKAK